MEKSSKSKLRRAVYMDYNATTPIDPRVAHQMSKCMMFDGTFGNPASRSHVFGWEAEELVEEARVQTAEVIAKGIDHLSSEVIIEERLNDFNLGEISGTFGWDKVAEIFPEQAQLRLQDPMRFHPSGGESGAEFEARLRSLMEELMGDDTTKLMVSHGIVNKFIRGIYKNLSGKEMINLGESQNTIYRLEHGDETEIKIPPSNREKN